MTSENDTMNLDGELLSLVKEMAAVLYRLVTSVKIATCSPNTYKTTHLLRGYLKLIL